MCYHDSMRRKKGEMSFELFKICADQIAQASLDTEIWFSFHGEPLLVHNRLFKMIAYAKSLGIQSLNLNSNGMLLGPELVQPILDSGVDLVVFGVDGISRKTYENVGNE